MTYDEFWRPLAAIYERGEAQAVARLALDERFGLTLADVLGGAVERLPEAELAPLRQRLLAGEPVQYVLGDAWFCGRRFHVEPGVLIPRPETEELCRRLLARTPGDWQGDILDIGTGSGCIAVTLAAELPQARVAAWDVSAVALRVARDNAERHGVPPGRGVDFRLADALDPPQDDGRWDIIVSNPPYVCEQEKGQMERNVLDHEPHLALFVPDDDPLRFYRAIGRYACRALKAGGQLYLELNARHAHATASLLRGLGLAGADVGQDAWGKDRFIRAWK